MANLRRVWCRRAGAAVRFDRRGGAMAAYEHVSMETGMSGDTAGPTAAGSCARREADQQCAVAGFVVLEPWATTTWRTLVACSIERQATVAFHDHQGLHRGSAHGPVHRQLPSSMSRSDGHVSGRCGTRRRVETSREDVRPAAVAKRSGACRHRPTTSVRSEGGSRPRTAVLARNG